MRISGTSRCLAVLVAAALSVGGSVLTASPAVAAPWTGDFYLPPDPLPDAAPGDILRSEPIQLPLSLPIGGVVTPARAQRIMYRSNDTHGNPVAVTGTYFEPSAPWTGPGDRPVVAVAPGTQGQGDQCAPSKTFAELIHYTFPLDLWVNYEVLTAYTLLARGMSVVVTDYYGLGTPAMHDWINRRSQAHAVLDAARAAKKLPGTSLTAGSPVALAGYSQGGSGAAAAAELQPTYAPELEVRGSVIGAPPADLLATVHSATIEGGPLGNAAPSGAALGLFGYIANGIAADYPEAVPEIDRIVNADGKRMMAEVATTCVAEMGLRYMYRGSAMFTTSGRTLVEDILASPTLLAILDEQRIGRLTPGAPVLISSSTGDDVIPYAQVRQLAADWCGSGATVQLSKVDWLPPLLPSTNLGHDLGMLPYLVESAGWLGDRFAGVPAASNCARLPD
ncbi:lipase family protein [Nocardia sp. NPDC058379]|uniref:lipase family protein n=1 Tax=unclassified Nocardia TaxID=2637762 RepID=UPI00364B4133